MEAPKIAVLHASSSRPHNPGFQQELDALNASVVDRINGLGYESQLLACSETLVTRIHALVAESEAVVIMGGEDVHPAFYDGPLDYTDNGWHEPLSDRVHIEVIKSCVESGKPLLGICRGMQLLNVALGGTLIQHLKTSGMHRGEQQGFGPFVRHPVRLTSTGMDRFALSNGVQDGEVVFSTHHQAIAQLGEGLEVLALAPDGVVEAVAHRSGRALGVQWHPEHPDVMTGSLERLFGHVYAPELR